MINQHPIDAGDFFAATLAHRVCDDCRQQLPDLSRVNVFIPNALAARQLRTQLVRTAGCSLLGPYIGSLQQWLQQHMPLADAELTPINPQARRLLLIDALNQHPQLFNQAAGWQLCDSLLELFDELGQNNPELLDSAPEHWLQQLQQAYGIDGESIKLSHEAGIVHTLWTAWQQQLQAMRLVDGSGGHRQRLTLALQRISDQHFYIVGEEALSRLERSWCEQLADRNQLTCVDQQIGDPPAGTAADFYRLAYDQDQPLLERAMNYRDRANPDRIYPDSSGTTPQSPPLSVFAAGNGEQEAAAIDIQTRRWLSEDKSSIAIVSEDRKLARRVRALLERAGIRVQDTAGWSLATTSAAACVERWLECIEEDFAYQPLLDLLKSPFFVDDHSREQHLGQVFRLEQDIIRHENIPSDIGRYRSALWQRRRRLQHWSSGTYDNIAAMLDLLEQQARDLRALYRQDRPRPARQYLDALLGSLQQLNIQARLEDDLAGARILQLLSAMHHSLDIANPAMEWSDFRNWLASSLEQEPFTPQDQPSPVYLMNMQQAQYCRFDGLIIAGASKASLPGSSSQSAFFNHRVRQSLGLSNWSDDKQAAFERFRHLLQAADAVLISYTAEHEGEWIQPSPWVTSLQDFYRLACNGDLQSDWLAAYFRQANRGLKPETESVAAALQKHPGSPLHAELVPDEFSASRYQRLVNCPYQFFAADGLSLKPEESISQELLKSEYGEKVHLILYAFHSQVDKLPEPFPGPVTAQNREAALQHLVALSKRVFEKDIEDNVQHRGWLQRWLQTAEAYIDWLIKRQADWSIHQLEQQLESNIDPHTLIKGRLDRVDRNRDAYAIIDYKTGSTPTQSRVNSGEDVQLVSYAKLLEPVSEVAYLKLDRGEARISASLKDEQLDEIKQQSLQRLQSIIEAIRQGHRLRAWGDRDACRYCDMQGLCRKQIWENLQD